MPVSRRSFLAGSAGVAGSALAARLAGMTEAALGAPIAVPAQARSVEAGLTAFAAKLQPAAPALALTRFGRFLTNKIFNCRVDAVAPRAYVLTIGTAGASLRAGVDPFAHAELLMEERDWLGILYGDHTALAPLLAGRFHPSRDEANRSVLLGILMYVLAHIPAGAAPDPLLLARIIEGAIGRRGLPDCPGEPPPAEVLERLSHDPQGEARNLAAPRAGAVPVTRELARWVRNLSFARIPRGAVESAKEQLVSILAVTYAGSTMEPGERAARAVRDWAEAGRATVIGRTRFRTTARNAAMVNSFLAQILEWEDWTYLAHSGAAIVPVALAVAEHAGASGRDVLAAIVAGNEILARAGDVLTDGINTGNALAVHQIETTLVAGKLLGLPLSCLQDALGIACTQPQTTSIIAWTADAKGMLTGWPAATAVTAALLAKAGMTGNRTILENGIGYCYRVSDIGSPARLAGMIEDLGRTWRFDASRDELFTKRYPTDGFQLTSVEAAVRLRRGPLRRIARASLPRRISRIEVRMPLVMAATATMFSEGRAGQRRLFARVRDGRRPDWTYIALLFDGVWPIAAALADGELTHRQYRRDKLEDRVILALADKMDLVPDLTMGVFGATVRVELTGGDTHETFVSCIDNFPVREKLSEAARDVLDDRRIAAVFDAVQRLERFDDIRDFTALL